MNVKLSSIFFLKTIAFVIGVAVLAVCIYWLPQAAIRDAKVRPGDYSIYPLLICAYGVCITFFVALSQIYKLLSYININNAISELSIKSLKVIKKCAFTIIIFTLLLIIYLRILAMFTGEDAAGPIALGLIGILVTAIIAAIIDVLQKPIKHILENM
ncbi:DUF2975 domain-containing protein [Lysinibacillus sp. NPDC097279]|uniref:DUF2975 domain-containing protein n=1 Tax=Lysinibacillus sp. NPDC097279 TaxID=3364143 RepID=UPI003805E913